MKISVAADELTGVAEALDADLREREHEVIRHGALNADERKALEERGHTLREGTRKWGNMQVVTWDYKTNKVEAASDPRGAGVGLVY